MSQVERPLQLTADPISHYQLESVSRACQLLKLFADEDEALTLAEISKRSGLEKTVAFRVVHTLVAEGFLRKAGCQRYCRCVKLMNRKRFRIGYAAQTAHSPFSEAVTASLRAAAKSKEVDLLEFDNHYRARDAVRNAERLIAEGIDLAIEFQTHERVAPTISALFQAVRIPLISVDIPHPAAVYFGIDNYRAGLTIGRYLGKCAQPVWDHVDEVILLGVNFAGNVSRQRISGIQDGLKGFLPAGFTTRYTEARGEFSCAFNTIRKHLRHCLKRRTLIAGINDQCVLGALRAFEEAGCKDFCLAAGMGAIPQAREELRKRGSRLLCSLSFFPERYGERLLNLALEMLQKRPVLPTNFATQQLITGKNINAVYPLKAPALKSATTAYGLTVI